MKNNLKKIACSLFAAACTAFAAPSHAQWSWSYDFGNWFAGPSGPYQPADSFATLSISTSNFTTFNLTLSALGNFNALFGSNAFIAKAVFNTATNADPLGISNVQTNGVVPNITLATNNFYVGGVSFDFFDCFSAGVADGCYFPPNRLTSNETISWTVNFASQQAPLLTNPPVAIMVHNWGPNGTDTSWYTPTPVPEPETYAMMLAGLGLMGFVARRRRAALAA